MNAQLYIDLGKILEARAAHKHALGKFREKHSTHTAAVVAAEADFKSMGFFEDCGSFYEERLQCAKTRLDETMVFRQYVVSLEKHFKKLKHEFREKYPDSTLIMESALLSQ